MPSRRRFLSALAAGTAAVAGCSSRPGNSQQTTSQTTPTTERTTTSTTTTETTEQCDLDWDVSRRWTFDRDVLGDPVVATDRVFVGSDQNVFALDAGSGDVAHGWPVEGSVYAVADGLLVVDAGRTVAAYDLATNEERWTFDTPGDRSGTSFTAAVHDGTLYVGATQYETPQTDPEFEYGRLYGFDLQTGDVVVERDLTRDDERWVKPAYVVADDTGVYVTLDDGGLLGLDSDGAIRWRRDGDNWYYPPVRAGDVVVQPRSASVVAVDPDTGETKWTHDGPEMAVAAADGVVYGTGGGSPQTYGAITALDAATGEARWTSKLDGCGGTIAAADGVLATAVDCRKPRVDVYDATEGCRLGSITATTDASVDLEIADDTLYATLPGDSDELAAFSLP